MIVHTDSVPQVQASRICPTDKAQRRKTRRSLAFDSRWFATELTNGLKISVLDLTVPQVKASSKLVQSKIRILLAVTSYKLHDVRRTIRYARWYDGRNRDGQIRRSRKTQ
jgi:hypothetical protein